MWWGGGREEQNPSSCERGWFERSRHWICWRPVSIAHWRTYYWGTSPTLEEEKELEEESKKTLYSKLWSQLCSTQVHWFILRLNMVNTWPEATHSEAYFRKEWHGVRNCINTSKWSADIHFKVLFLSVCPLLLTILHGQSLPECQVPKMSGCATNSSSNYDIDDPPPPAVSHPPSPTIAEQWLTPHPPPTSPCSSPSLQSVSTIPIFFYPFSAYYSCNWSGIGLILCINYCWACKRTFLGFFIYMGPCIVNQI